jgi:two-component system sensor histidine kinase KdpD
MYDDQRPDPDTLLEAVQREENKQERGKLKIYLGMSAGVGKTYAMLEAARQRLAEGVDVVIGYVETHGRAETGALVKGLPIIPRRKLEYKGSTLEEMDLDAILQRKPQLVLVDELAHTNVEGSRHPKRYQDVLELLDAGIDVYTTVNVQHLESRADTVAQITGVIIREKVPDTLIDIADKIELIDLEPDELLKRLEEGKVYTADRAELAAKNFFRKGNLTALREMALRLTAEHVDQQMQDYMQIKQIAGPWKSGDRLMVAVSPSPLSQRLIRWTRRTAYTLKAPWTAVYIDTLKPLSDDQKAQLGRNLALVRELGGDVLTSTGENPASEIVRLARAHNITQVVVGKPARSTWQEWLSGGSMVNRLIRLSGDIDVYVVTGEKDENTDTTRIGRPTIHSNRQQYFLAIGVVLAATLINYVVAAALGSHREVTLIMLFVVVVLANFVGRGPILVAAALSALLMDFLFLPPHFTFDISSFQDALILGLYFIIALVTGNFTARLAQQRSVLQQRDERASALYLMARQIAEAANLDDVVQTAVRVLSELFDAEVIVFLADSLGTLSAKPHEASTFQVDDKERSVAEWAFDHNQASGRFTDTLPTASAQYLPLATPGGVAGVIGIRLKNGSAALSSDQEALLRTCVSHIALAVERDLLDEAARQAEVVEESERLYATLLDSISHELKTPLTQIDAAVTELTDPANLCNAMVQTSTGKTIQEASSKLNSLFDNLLDMTRVQSGHLKLNVEPVSLRTLVEEAVALLSNELKTHDVVIDVPPDLPTVLVDAALMRQVLVNLLHNAAVHTPPDARIRVTGRVEDNELVFSVADRGPGIPPVDLQRVFEKFYRAPGTDSGGVGLGLSICKGIVEAHGGTITAENRPTRGGARFTVRLPLESVHSMTSR